MGIRSLLRNAFGRSRAARKDRTDNGEGTVPEVEPTGASATATPDTAEAGAAADETASADASAASSESPASSTASESAPDAQAPAPAPAAETGARPAASDAAAEKPAAQPEEETSRTGEADEDSGAPETTEPAEEPVGDTPSTTAPTATEPRRTIPAQPGAPEAEQTDSTAVPPADSAPEEALRSSTPESDPGTEESTPASGEAATPAPEDEAAQPEAEDRSASIPAQRTAAEERAAVRVPAQRTAPPAEPKAAEPEPEPADPAQNDGADGATAPDEPARAAEHAAAGSPGASAVSLAKVEKSAPGLVSLYKKAGAALDAGSLGGQRAAVYLVLDRSGSMRRYYKDGTVQHLAEQALALSAHLDDDGTVPVVFFSTDIDGVADVSLERYEGRIEALHADLGHMGRTNYHRAIEAVIEHYKKSGATDPAFVIFQTDGAPTSKPAAEKALCEAAKLPIFWQFIGFGDPEAKGFDFLRKLDTLTVPEKRPVDNAGFFHAGADPLLVADDELYAKLTAEFPAWLESARKAGILR